MKRRMFTIMSMAFAIVVVMGSCKKEKVTTQSGDNPSEGNVEIPSGDEIIKNAVTDIDGNTYDAVKLGNQVWMAENLRTTKYADGTTIPMGSTGSYDVAYRYCPNNNSDNVSTYGYLYNWPAMMHNSSSSGSNPSGVQGICPNGWHVPSDAEWTQLTDYVSSQSQYVCGGNNTYIAKALASTTGWISDDNTCTPGNNPSANNATGFSAVPAGFYDGNYNTFGGCARFWSATQGASLGAFGRYLYSNSANVNRNYYVKHEGLSVRCVRD